MWPYHSKAACTMYNVLYMYVNYRYMYTYTVREMFVVVRECVLLGTAEGATSQA